MSWSFDVTDHPDRVAEEIMKMHHAYDSPEPEQEIRLFLVTAVRKALEAYPLTAVVHVHGHGSQLTSGRADEAGTTKNTFRMEVDEIYGFVG